MTTNFRKLAELGQSLWYDNIRRGMLDSGEMQALIDEGILGVTSNPSIFQKAIGESHEYDAALRTLARDGRSPMEVYEALAFDDIRRTADLFRSIYERTERRDGFVSIELEPALADDTAGSIARGRAIFRAIDRPNVMVKVPGTDAGLPAISALIGEGINVNVTLIFSVAVYQQVIDAYQAGLKSHMDRGGDPTAVASVASFFVSRIDTLVDKQLQERINAGQSGLDQLLGRAAVSSAKLAYAKYCNNFRGPRFATLASRGARPQRPLWGSTSTKNPAYRDTLYVDELIGPDTVNTVPHATLDPIRRLNAIKPTLERDVRGAADVMKRLEHAGIQMTEVTEELRRAGVKAFADSFDKLLEDIAAKMRSEA